MASVTKEFFECVDYSCQSIIIDYGLRTADNGLLQNIHYRRFLDDWTYL